MDCVVLIPGIMGSQLQMPDGEEIWPPTLLETQFGFGRKAKLLSDQARRHHPRCVVFQGLHAADRRGKGNIPAFPTRISSQTSSISVRYPQARAR